MILGPLNQVFITQIESSGVLMFLLKGDTVKLCLCALLHQGTFHLVIHWRLVLCEDPGKDKPITVQQQGKHHYTV